MSDFGSRLKAWRQSLGWTQKKFALETEIHDVQIKKYETMVSSPSADVLSRIATTGVNLHWLLTGEGEMSVVNHVLSQDDAFESEEEFNEFRTSLNRLYDLLLKMPEDRRESFVNQMLDQVEDIVKMKELERIVKELKKP